MKTTVTKTVEIEVCDACGQETHYPRKCVTCKRDMCSECADTFSVEVRRDGKMRPCGKMRSYSTKYEEVLGSDSVRYNAVYCLDCGQSIEKRLIDAGFIPSKVNGNHD